MAANDNECTHAAEPADVQETGPLTEPALTALTFGAQFVIWSARAWVTALKLDKPFEDVSCGTFEKLDLKPARASLDALLTIVAHDATRQIDIRCLQCPRVSPDESLLRRAVAAAQTEDVFAAYDALRNWLPSASARHALRPLTDFATELAARSFRLPPDVPDAAATPRSMLQSAALH
ncbi:hypothetical protein [Dongia sp.]|uniref:hypothetical protein n=1 Tax=Dongia sp. TaxID=1977262 RepID=UPI0035B14816